MNEALDAADSGRLSARWACTSSEGGLLFIFVNQIVTGVFLSLYYVPSDRPRFLHIDSGLHPEAGRRRRVSFGALHSYGSSAMVILLMLHLAQTYLYGAYKSGRELVWLMGCFLFLLVLGMSFTGYLLPWDQKAYFATAVATNIVSEVPVVGGSLKAIHRGGSEMGTLTLSRFFMLHVFAIPALIFAAVASHVFFFRRAGAAGPPLLPSKRAALPTEPFFPWQVFKDFVFGIGLIVVLGAVALARPASLGPMANPADATYLPRPEWYYIPVFQWLKYWHGPASVIGIVVIPAVIIAAFFLVPFLDRSPDRHPLRRPVPTVGFFLVFAALFFLGWRSHAEDRSDPAVASKVSAQEKEERDFAKAPFQPEEGLLAAASSATPSLTPEESKGALIFENESCSGCHGPGGRGGEGLTKLSGLSTRFPREQLRDLLRSPRPAMIDGGMEASHLPDADLNALVAYLEKAPAAQN